MTVLFKNNFFSGDISRGAETGTVTLVGRLNLGASYTTNGIALDFSTVDASLANANILYFAPAPGVDMANHAVWDSANGKAVVYVRSTDAELANATDISAVTKEFRCFIVFSIGTPKSETITMVA